MPFTPFHMGAALIVKPAARKYFSVLTFGIAQVAMDIEPGIGMVLGWEVLHGPSHTILGALGIACLVTWIAPWLCNPILRRYNREVLHHRLPWLQEPHSVERTAVLVGAFLGTLSHLLLDSLMHHDIRPMAPFSAANPLMDLVSHDGVYLLCLVTGAIGAILYLWAKWSAREMPANDTRLQQSSLLSRISLDGFWTRWVQELRSTWLWVFFLTAAPCVVFGSVFFSILILLWAILFGIPLLVLGPLIRKEPCAKGLRRLTVAILLPLLTLYWVIQAENNIPKIAEPVPKALESFRLETGRYPDTLDELFPKHLVKVPQLHYSFIHPKVIYYVTNGKPYMAIPTAGFDPFDHFEYNFSTKVWKRNN